MIWSPPNRFASVSAEELAAAMRAGLDGRRHVAPPSSGPPRTDFLLGPEFDRLVRLLAVSGVRGTPAPTAGGSRLLRPARRLLKFLAHPWLDKQTRFNHETFEHLVHLHDYLTRLAVRVNGIQRDLDTDVLTATRATNARLNEFFHDVQRLKARHADGEHADSADGPNAAVLRPLGSPPVDPLHVIESLFLCSRLPAPPGRVLVLAPVGLHALNLATLGYAVVQYGLSGDTLHHPGLIAHRPGGPAGGALPFDDESFDVAVSMAAEGESVRGLAAADPHSEALVAELDRVLGPDGVVVGSALVPPTGLSVDRVGDWLAPFEVRDVAFGHRAGHGWALAADPGAESEVALYVAGRA